MRRDLRIDYLKAMAIISVILLHSFKTDYENSILGPFHILQAVPVFLLLTGLNLVNSFERKRITSLIYFYSWEQITKRLKRLLIPFTIVWIFQLYVQVSMSVNVLTIKYVLLTFIQGGWGPGSYFIPLILQVVFGLPLLYLWAKRNPVKMLIGTFVINVSFELYAYYSYMPNEIYRFISLRYLFIVGLGVYMAFKASWNKWFEIGTFFSLVYILAIHYFELKPAVQPNWSSQNVYSYFWPYALVILGLSRLKNTAKSLSAKVMKIIGEASYHIFLTQMVYFWAFQPFPTMRILYKYPPTKLALINIFLCLIFGIAFFYIEKMLLGKIKVISLFRSKNRFLETIRAHLN